MINFIFMLTKNDTTVPNAFEVLESVKDTGLKYIGFKDVGATPELQKKLADAAHEAGMTVFLEVVSITEADEKNSVAAGIKAGVDWILGGTFADESAKALEGTNIKFAPFPGRIVGHPSILEGTQEEIAEHAAKLVKIPEVGGVDLLAYRHQTIDPVALTAATVKAIAPKPLIAAGSVVTEKQIKDLAGAGAWGFTIGSAIFDAKLPGEKDVPSQVRTALRFAAQA
jgi:2-keto-3-deoxy-6-phosphogluconate aldolase